MYHPNLGHSDADANAIGQLDTTKIRMEINHMKRHRPMGEVKKLRFGIKREADSTFQSRVAVLKELFDRLSTSDLQVLYGHIAPLAAPRGEFDLFRRLPLELRLMIWKAAMPLQRVLEVDPRLPLHDSDWDRIPKEWKRRYSDCYDDPNRLIIRYTKPSAIIQVCQESREEALKKYSLIIEAKFGDSYTRIDPFNDTVYFLRSMNNFLETNTVHHLILKDDAYKNIKQLAICLETFAPRHKCYPHVIFVTLGKFTALEDFTIVAHDYCCEMQCDDDHTFEWALTETDVEEVPLYHLVAGHSIRELVIDLEAEFLYYREDNPSCGVQKLKWAVFSIYGEERYWAD